MNESELDTYHQLDEETKKIRRRTALRPLPLEGGRSVG